MATLKELYETDFQHAATRRDRTVQTNNDGYKFSACQLVDPHTVWLAYYLDEEHPELDSLVPGILQYSLEFGEDREILILFPDTPDEDPRERTPPPFSRVVYLYIEGNVDSRAREVIKKHAKAFNLDVRIRDEKFRAYRASVEKPLAFLSHDSRDKVSVAKPLALELIKQRCPVWYDEFTLSPGDNLRESIEKGIRECRKCILILTPNFISNTGWTKREFEGVFTREIIEDKKLILTVWHQVSAKEVYQYSPTLANILGVSTDDGISSVAAKLSSVIMRA